MKKVSITAQHVMVADTGMFSSGDVLTSPPHSEALLRHLVEDAGAAMWVEEHKMDVNPVEKKAPSTPSSQPAQASRKKTRGSRTGKQPASS